MTTVLAWVGGLAIVCSVGWFVFCWRTASSGRVDPAEPSPERSNVTVIRRDAGHVTFGQALGVALILGALLLLLGLAGAVETGGLS